MRTILITGATDGIGLATAKQLASLGHELVLHGRSEEKALRARDEVLRATPDATLHTAYADLSDLAEIARMALDLAKRRPRLDVLINNAGVYMTERRLSHDGYEMTLAVNHIAHFLLAHLLLPLLQKSDEPRVVTVSSMVHSGGRVDFGNLNSERHFDGYEAYADSKLANVLFAFELARREPWLVSNSLHPGIISTKLLHTAFDMTGDTVALGAQTSVHLATSVEVQGISGKYFDHCAAVPASSTALNHALAQQLWKWTEGAVQPYLSAAAG